jgi:hypothetical protein
MRSWKHSGFSVDQSVRLEGGDQQGVQRLIQYFLRCPFSQARMIEVTDAGKVIYKTEHNAVGRFPEPGDEELLAGPSRNFQIFDPLDFLAEVTQHIPDPGSHLVRLNRRPRRKRGDCTRRSGERSAHRAGASSTGVAPAFRTPLQPSRSLAEPAAAMGSRPAQSPWRQGGVSRLNPAPFALEQSHPSGHAPTTRRASSNGSTPSTPVSTTAG